MPSAAIEQIQEVGPDTVAITCETPDQFDAYPGQFILVRADIDGEEVTGYYTLSSPEIRDHFEITVAVDAESGTLGPWLAEQEVGATIDLEGPFGDVYYNGDGDVTVLASGPGIGPAVAIGEQAQLATQEAAIFYQAETPAHADRLSSLRDAGVTVDIFDPDTDLREMVRTSIIGDIYVFGFAEFVNDAKDALESIGVDSDRLHVESFGPA